MSASQRRKGHSWERAVASLMREVFPGENVRRGQQGMGAVEADVVTPLVWLECKVGKVLHYEAALLQAALDSINSGRWPVAVLKKDRARPVVMLYLDDFAELLAAHWQEVRPR